MTVLFEVFFFPPPGGVTVCNGLHVNFGHSPLIVIGVILYLPAP